MKNQKFEVVFDGEKGGISALYLCGDEYKMNWLKEGHVLNLPLNLHPMEWDADAHFRLERFTQDEKSATAIFMCTKLTVTAKYSFTKEGNLRIENTFANNVNSDLYFMRGNLGLTMPLCDEYESALVSLTTRCHAHLWCGGTSSYIYALRQGISPLNLGMALTQGSVDGYSQEGGKKNDRGAFILHPDLPVIHEGETLSLCYEFFPHGGEKEFFEILRGYPSFVEFSARNLTCFVGERGEITVRGKKIASVRLEGERAEIQETEEGVKVSFIATSAGEKTLFVEGENTRTWAKINVLPDLEKLIETRIRFIVDKQQNLEAGNHLYGAYVIYDNEDGRQYVDEAWGDYSASRERLGMGLTIAKWLQSHEDEKIKQSLALYLEFLQRELYDEETGEVFSTIKRYSPWLRLYNFSWMALIFAETYPIFRQEKLLDGVVKVMNAYYERGGFHFYPNGISMVTLYNALANNGRSEQAAALLEKFVKHVENIKKNGLNYPEHEVIYEQTIVTPAVRFMLDLYEMTGDESYLASAEEHIQVLTRFDGVQPHYMLRNIPIRHWDGFWFGKTHVFGDTLPHYWSTLSSVNYIKYGRMTENQQYVRQGIDGLKNALCLFKEDGTASCASLFAFKSNGVRGEKMDEFANDQDFALYFAQYYLL